MEIHPRFTEGTASAVWGMSFLKIVSWGSFGILLVLSNQASAIGTDSFLDAPLPRGYLPHVDEKDRALQEKEAKILNPPMRMSPDFIEYASYAERIRDLQALMPCPIVFPEGFAKFIKEEEDKSEETEGKDLFPQARFGEPIGNTLRSLLNSSLNNLTLSGTYDPARKAIITDFRWHRTDVRSAAELAKFLCVNRPVAAEKLLEKGVGLDAWRIAFDALLSKPENDPAWETRFFDDVRRFPVTGMPLENLIANTVRDKKGDGHFFIVNNDPIFTVPGTIGSVFYYVFDSKGKFESGGGFGTGHRCMNTTAWLNREETELTVRTYFDGFMAIDTSYTVSANGLVEQNPVPSSGAGLGTGEILYATSLR